MGELFCAVTNKSQNEGSIKFDMTAQYMAVLSHSREIQQEIIRDYLTAVPSFPHLHLNVTVYGIIYAALDMDAAWSYIDFTRALSAFCVSELRIT